MISWNISVNRQKWFKGLPAKAKYIFPIIHEMPLEVKVGIDYGCVLKYGI